MNYNQLVQIIQTSAANVNANGLFMHGRHEDFSNEFANVSIGAGNPAICLFMPTPKISYNFNLPLQTVEYLIGFFKQDSPASTVSDIANIFNTLDILSNSFLTDLNAVNPNLKLVSAIKYPEIRLFQGTLTGLMINLTIQVPSDLCI